MLDRLGRGAATADSAGAKVAMALASLLMLLLNVFFLRGCVKAVSICAGIFVTSTVLDTSLSFELVRSSNGCLKSR
jgi:hypothetical protein